jgi:hypothetical protein
MLREVATAGTWVSAHPDTILAMGTKEVLYRTRDFSWGTDTEFYATVAEFEERFPSQLAAGRPRVLKQHRGNGGIGVWKVEPIGAPAIGRAASVPGRATLVRVQHAATRDATTEALPLGVFMARCRPYFAGTGRLIDQRFVPRIRDGMVRAYLVERELVGFARQRPVAPTADNGAPPLDKVLGLSGAKTMYGADEPAFGALKADLEGDWVPEGPPSGNPSNAPSR